MCFLFKIEPVSFESRKELKSLVHISTAGIYILKKIRNFTKTKVQNGETLPKLNIGIYSKFDQYYRYNIIMYDFIHIIQFLIPIWSWISKMMQEMQLFSLFFWNVAEKLLCEHYWLFVSRVLSFSVKRTNFFFVWI